MKCISFASVEKKRNLRGIRAPVPGKSQAILLASVIDVAGLIADYENSPSAGCIHLTRRPFAGSP